MESCNNNIHAASDGGQDKKVRVRVLGSGTYSKNKLQSPPQADRHRKPTNAVDKRLGRQMGAAHRKRTRVGPNCRDLAIGNWNVSSLTEKEQELVYKPNSIALMLWEFHQQSAGVLELSSRTVGGKFSTQVLMQQCLIKLVLAHL